MRIWIENHTKKVSYGDVHDAIACINLAFKRDFDPAWGTKTSLQYRKPTDPSPDKATEAVIYLFEEPNVQDALGYHDANNNGVPYGFVFTELAKQLGEDYSVTLSHEAFEIVPDALANLLAPGPHPNVPSRVVFFWYEACDPVQDESYLVTADVASRKVTRPVSNFVLPVFYTMTEEPGPTNFMKTPLKSFGIRPGGYVGFYDPTTGKTDTVMRQDDTRARARMRIKQQAGSVRRASRYKAALQLAKVR